MLTSLRKRQKPLCNGLIVLLLCSWVSYVCQPCLAHDENTEPHHGLADKMPCHPVNNIHKQTQPDDSGKSTTPDCDCHLLIALNIHDPDSWLMVNSSPDFDHPLYMANTTNLESWPSFTDRYRIYSVPERALSPPFDRYTVLLN